MLKPVRFILAFLTGRFRSRAVVELENLALRHQLQVLPRRRPGRLRLIAIDRLLWVWLYRLWPRCLDTMVLVKPATVVQWHRQGFRLFWRWRSRSGRPSVDREVRKFDSADEQRQPALGSTPNPRRIAQARHRDQPSDSCQVHGAKTRDTFPELAQLSPQSGRRHRCDRHVRCGIRVVSLLYVMIILTRDRRKIVRFDVTRNPTAGWLSRQVTEAFPWDTAPRYLLRDRDGRTARNSADGSMRWESQKSSPLRAHLGKTLSSSASSVRFAAIVWITT
jgi:putative transposase